MIVERFNKINEYSRERGYFIKRETGELRSGFTFNSDIFLTEDEYKTIKPLADSINKACINYNDMKNTQIERLELAILKIKKDTRIRTEAEKYNL